MNFVVFLQDFFNANTPLNVMFTFICVSFLSTYVSARHTAAYWKRTCVRRTSPSIRRVSTRDRGCSR